MIKKLLPYFFLLVTSFAFAQELRGTRGGLYKTNKDNVDKGWFLGPGLTYMQPYLKQTNSYNLANGFTQDYTAKGRGKIGLMLEVGLFRMNKKRVINYFDFGLSYKWLRGKELYETSLYDSLNNKVFTLESENKFSDHLISGNINIGNHVWVNYNKFFLNGIGLNGDFFMIPSRKSELAPLEPHKFPETIVAQLHYFFGIGFKVKERLIIMPMVETPIFAIYPFNHIVSTHDYFNTRYRPILLKVRFMFLKNQSKTCPPVHNPMGINPDDVK
ncbi:MAG: hypothetical protein Kow0079_00860 [Vicingaceae bacterium]